MITCLVIDDASLAGPYTDGSFRTTKRKRSKTPTAPVRKIFVASRDF
jgi:hypothetical protein